MTTIAEALQSAADALGQATANLTAIRDQVAAQLATTTSSATTIINNFLNRPFVRTVHVDPVNGKDTNDGSTYALARKSIDAVIGGGQDSAINILLYGEDTLRLRQNLTCNLSIQGAVRDLTNPLGWSPYQRGINVLGEASNSPLPDNRRVSAGIFLYALSLNLQNCYIVQPDVPAGVLTTSVVVALTASAINIGDSVIAPPTNTGRGTLISAPYTQIGAFFQNVTMSGNAPGRLFEGVAAASDPRTNWHYRTNLTTA